MNYITICKKNHDNLSIISYRERDRLDQRNGADPYQTVVKLPHEISSMSHHYHK